VCQAEHRKRIVNLSATGCACITSFHCLACLSPVSYLSHTLLAVQTLPAWGHHVQPLLRRSSFTVSYLSTYILVCMCAASQPALTIKPCLSSLAHPHVPCPQLELQFLLSATTHNLYQNGINLSCCVVQFSALTAASPYPCTPPPHPHPQPQPQPLTHTPRLHHPTLS